MLPSWTSICLMPGAFPLLTRGSGLESHALLDPRLEGEDYSVTEGSHPRSQAGQGAHAGGVATPGRRHCPLSCAHPASLEPRWGGVWGGRTALGAQRAWLLEEDRGGAGSWGARCEHVPGQHLRGLLGASSSQGLGPGAGTTGVWCTREAELLTHLAEAVTAGQCRFAERKVSHCGRRERTRGPGGRWQPRASVRLPRCLQ